MAELGNGHHPNCQHYARTDVKVWKINDYEWAMAPTLDEAIQAVCDMTGVDRDDVADEPHELTDEELLRLKFVDEDESKRSFAEELNRRVAQGIRVQYFASTEY